ncbi:adenylyltransferase/cytidyltransferase family protein [Ectopseudomonas khazarica]|uniref:adenylyltransferase/cytidyltransferase family protein n=1 Tax=Ectopseudomonas khazarica TaxID=2502979 RepID=UPI0037C87057
MKRVLVPGVFDVFHIGHLNYLKSAATMGDHLTVAVQEDRVVERAKGTAMVTPLPERIALIEQLRFVDQVVSYVDVFQGPLLEALNIDVFACGSEYGSDKNFPDQVKTLEYCENNGVEVARIQRTASVSSTEVRARLKAFWASRAAKEKDLPAGVTVLGSFGGEQDKVREETLREAELVLAAVDEPASCSLADIACGDGRLLVELAPYFRESVGVDYVEDLLELARKRLAETAASVQLVAADATSYREARHFDVFLLSGIVPCLDDVQMTEMLSNVSGMAHSASRCLVRTSVSLNKRINVVNQFSPELGQVYTGYYRTVSELELGFLDHGWRCKERFQLYQHRPDTAVWWFEFERSED